MTSIVKDDGGMVEDTSMRTGWRFAFDCTGSHSSNPVTYPSQYFVYGLWRSSIYYHSSINRHSHTEDEGMRRRTHRMSKSPRALGELGFGPISLNFYRPGKW